MKPVEVGNVGFMSNFVNGQQKNRKTPFSVINANFTYFVIQKKYVLLSYKSRDSEVFKYV